MKKIFLLAAVTLALTACNNDNYDVSPVAAKISATIGESVTSRVSGSSWVEGDMIGITTTYNSQVGPFINMKYTTKGGDGAFEGNAIYIYNPMSLTAYYPFTDSENKLPGSNGVISAVTDAANQTSTTQPLIDFLYAAKSDITSDEPRVVLDFSHKMSKLTFIFKDGTGADVSNITSYTIDGLVLSGTFDTATGVCAIKSDEAAAPLVMSVDGVQSGTEIDPVIIFPQSVPEMTVKLTITDADNQIYSCFLNFTNNEIAAGKNYQYTITVNKTGLTVNESTIINWDKEELGGEAGSDLS